VVAGLLMPARPALAGQGLRVVGNLPEPKNAGGYIVNLDAESRRMYYLWENLDSGEAVLREYDLRPAIPRVARESPVGTRADFATSPRSPYTTVLDRSRDRLLMLGVTTSGPGDGRTTIRMLDLKTFRLGQSWDLTTQAPGFVGYGMTYSPEDDRIYLVGDFWGTYPLGAGVGSPPVASPLPAAVAVDPADGHVLWIRAVPQCQRVLNAFAVGALVARSRYEPRLYFPCTNASNLSLASGGTAQGQAGLVRLTISSDATQQEAVDFPMEFFPIGGVYYNGARTGIAAFDPASERVFIQSLSPRTPGAWVFDGLLTAWVGQIASPDPIDPFLGLDEASGHYYIGTTESLLVSDARATPVPQGEAFPYKAGGFIAVDPVSHRMFVRVDGATPEAAQHYLILKDETATGSALPPTNYDSLTTRLAEGPDTISTYAGTVTGWGMRAFLVGGSGGLLSAVPGGATDVGIDQLKPADRGVTAARVTKLDLRNVGAASTAQPLALDDVSADDYERTRLGFDEPIQSLLAWPYPAATCLDAGGSAQDDGADFHGSSSSVKCDVEGSMANASATHGAITLEGVRVAASSYTAEVRRDPKLGTVTTARAVARGIELGTEATGFVSIGRVVATSRTVAHGHPGTAEVTWHRGIQNVYVEDGQGAEVFSCDAESSCDLRAAIAAINSALGHRVRVSLPKAVTRSTPAGAFAGVGETDADYYNDLAVNNEDSRAVPALEIVAFNDTAEKSRLFVQLAAIEASSIYGITPLSVDEGEGNNGGGPLPGGVDLPPTLPPVDPGTGVPTPPPNIGPPPGGSVGLVSGVSLILRSPKEALLFGGLLMLFGTAAAGLVRRRLLLRLLET
jgi:hypothetical protein